VEMRVDLGMWWPVGGMHCGGPWTAAHSALPLIQH